MQIDASPFNTCRSIPLEMPPFMSDNAPPSHSKLRLLAFDAGDLAVLSAHLENAEIARAEMAFLPRERRFAFVASRPGTEGVETGVHFDHVLAASHIGFETCLQEDMLQLLSISFSAQDAPAGHVLLVFSCGKVIRLDVECLEACLRDMDFAQTGDADAAVA